MSAFTYKRHNPKETLTYQVINESLDNFYKHLKDKSGTLPTFVKREFEEYLKCGILGHGFVRCYCYTCGSSKFIGFSCKKRGFCNSCLARRAADTAAHIMDFVLPKVNVRQWVLSVPKHLQFLIAHNPKLTSFVLSYFIQAIQSWIRKSLKKSGYKKVQVGAISFIQRFNGALALYPHLHCLFMDGGYVMNSDGTPVFLSILPPTDYDLGTILVKVIKKTIKLIEKINYTDSQEYFEDDVLKNLQQISLLGKSLMPDEIKKYSWSKTKSSKNANGVQISGFSIHAGVAIEDHKREKIEKLLRYMGRGPLSESRMGLENDKVVIRLKSRWSDGTEYISMTQCQFIERLCSLIPPPKSHLIRFHGVFAPNSKLRSKIVPKQKLKNVGCTHNKTPQKLKWAELLKRVYAIDVMVCDKCGGRLEQIAIIKQPEVISAILRSVGLEQELSLGP